MNRRHLLLFAGVLTGAGLILDAGVPSGLNRNRRPSPGSSRADVLGPRGTAPTGISVTTATTAPPTLASAITPRPQVAQLPEGCYAPGTSQEVIQRNAERRADLISSLQGKGFQFSDVNRWSTTATNGGGLTQGQVTTLTWNIVPDGTPIPGFNGEPAAASNLQAFLTGIYGSEAAWLAQFQTVFDQWGALTGVNYVKINVDDGATLDASNATPGVLGVRADVRISGHFIDGNFNVLAYNFFPNVGDMVIDTGDSYYSGGGLADNSLGLRNMLAHEHGHGLGMNHTCPINQTKLMEPTISTAYEHAQFDDKLAGWRGYGDDKENNETSGTAFNLGSPGNGVTTINDVSADDNSDIDFYKFTVPAGKFAAVTMTPTGTTYLSGPQVGACDTGSSFNALAVNDLGVDLRGTDGTTVLATANAFGAGVAENIPYTSLGGAGTYFVRVFAGAVNNVQGYQLALTISDLPRNASINDVSVAEGNAGVTNATFTVSLDGASASTLTLNYATANGTAVGGALVTQGNATGITIPGGNASLYPSNIVVSGASGTITKATATLNGFSHAWPRDVDVLLVGPGGQKIVLMSDAGGTSATPASNVTLTLDATAASSLPAGGLSSGTFKPTNLSDNEPTGADAWGAPAPSAPYDGSLNDLIGVSPNGTWSLYIVDDSAGDTGSLAGGWTLNLSTTGGDYAPVSGMLSFAPGEVSKSVVVPINGDLAIEPNETFTVGLSNPSPGLLIADGSGLGTILNDDGAPVIVPVAASLVTDSTATLNSTVNPNGQSTSAIYQYGLTTSYGTSTGATALGSGGSPVPFNAPVTGLACNTLFHFRAVATNGAGATNGGDLTFTTSACPLPPTVTTNAPTSVTQTGATLNGAINPNSGATNRRFEYGLTTGYGFTSPDLAIGNGSSPVSVSFGATGLSCNTLYHYRAVGQNSGGTTNGLDATFTTAACPGAGNNNISAVTAQTLSLESISQDSMSNVRAEIRFRVRLFASRSYQVSAWPVNHEQGTDAPTLGLSLFSDNAGTVAATPAPTVSSGVLEGSPNNNGDALPSSLLFQPTATGVYKIRVLRTSGGTVAHSINLAVRETTLFSPWTSRAAGFEGFIEMHNNTNAALNVTLRGYDSTGALLGAGITFSIPANATVFKTANETGVPVNVFAGIVLTHGGAVGAISANITTLNGANGLSFDSPFTPRSPAPQGPPVR